ncbi:MAG: cation:proton antiporter, partial [Ignavibacteriota bacterium]
GGSFSIVRVLELFMIEAIGGAIFGLVLGWAAYLLTRSIDNYKVEVLLTLAIVTGGYALASVIGVSGPLAMVVAGIIVGNKARVYTMSEKTREALDNFWEIIESIINAVLFVLIGLEILVLPIRIETLLIAIGAIILLLGSRWVSVYIPRKLFRLRQVEQQGVQISLVWGGLRGGISIALALSVPAIPQRNMIILITYIVVIFSIVVQGLSFEKVLKSRMKATS